MSSPAVMFAGHLLIGQMWGIVLLGAIASAGMLALLVTNMVCASDPHDVARRGDHEPLVRVDFEPVVRMHVADAPPYRAPAARPPLRLCDVSVAGSAPALVGVER